MSKAFNIASLKRLALKIITHSNQIKYGILLLNITDEK